jgi:hypothetical protein
LPLRAYLTFGFNSEFSCGIAHSPG